MDDRPDGDAPSTSSRGASGDAKEKNASKAAPKPPASGRSSGPTIRIRFSDTSGGSVVTKASSVVKTEASDFLRHAPGGSSWPQVADASQLLSPTGFPSPAHLGLLSVNTSGLFSGGLSGKPIMPSPKSRGRPRKDSGRGGLSSAVPLNKGLGVKIKRLDGSSSSRSHGSSSRGMPSQRKPRKPSSLQPNYQQLLSLGALHNAMAGVSDDPFSFADPTANPMAIAMANMLLSSTIAATQFQHQQRMLAAQAQLTDESSGDTKPFAMEAAELLGITPCMVGLEKLPSSCGENIVKNEKWPGKHCALCSLTSKTTLGQGDLMYVQATKGFNTEEFLVTLKAILQEKETRDASSSGTGAGATGGSESDGSDNEADSADVFLKSPPPGGFAKPSKLKKSPVKPRHMSSSDKLGAGSALLSPLTLNTNVAGLVSPSLKSPRRGGEVLEEIHTVGYSEEPQLSTVFEASGNFFVHSNCASWSMALGVRQCDLDEEFEDESDEDEEEKDKPTENTEEKKDSSGTKEVKQENEGEKKEEAVPWKWLDRAVVRSFVRKCHHCKKLGASIRCRVPNCPRYFHFPCAAGSGAFQDARTSLTMCPQHLQESPLIAGNAAHCGKCNSSENLTDLLFCASCGTHEHATCAGVVANPSPGIRAGWQCASCRTCWVCRQPGASDNKVATCESCSRAYHGYCAMPPLKNVPDHGWRCKNCRMCGDCGSRVPGLGSSSRWHLNFTLCDGCYQLRNKGLSCPICGRAYRHSSQRDMLQCCTCRRYVHGSCDPEADPLAYAARKEVDPEYEYKCLACKSMPAFAYPRGLISPRGVSRGDDLLLESSQESWLSTGCDESSMSALEGEASDRDDLNRGVRPLLSPNDVSSPGILPGSSGMFSPTGLSATKKRPASLAGPSATPTFARPGFNKKAKLAAVESKREKKAKPKMRGIFGMPGIGLQRPTHDDQADKKAGAGAAAASKDDNAVEDHCLILCSANDDVVLSQDMCVMCGSVGQGQEGRLIACAQCGQAYHPYCVNTKVAKVILEKGWRCLDCTFCEGCGQPHDEGKLILCDECDVSYHIYCLDPPLDYVPQGNWKCKWCAVCTECGRNSPGKNSAWFDNFSVCGPCSSLTQCHMCSQKYIERDLIIQCGHCERWSHAICDLIRNEKEADICTDDGYRCLKCRPRDQPPPHLKPPTPVPKVRSPSPPPAPSPVPEPASPEVSTAPPPLLHQLGGNGGLFGRRMGCAPGPGPVFSASHLMDGVTLSDSGYSFIKDLLPDAEPARKNRGAKRKDLGNGVDGNATRIGDFDESSMADTDGLGGDQSKDDVGDGTDSSKKKRSRNMQRYGVGGFFVKVPKSRTKDKEGDTSAPDLELGPDGKPKRKQRKPKAKSKLLESFPSYMQDAFFGKDVLDSVNSTPGAQASAVGPSPVVANAVMMPPGVPAGAVSPSLPPLTPTATTPTPVQGSQSNGQARVLKKESSEELLDEEEDDVGDDCGSSLKLTEDDFALISEMKTQREEKQKKDAEEKAKKELARQERREAIEKKRQEKAERKARKAKEKKAAEDQEAEKNDLSLTNDDEEHEAVPDSFHDMLLSGEFFNDDLVGSLLEGDIEDAQLDDVDRDDDMDDLRDTDVLDAGNSDVVTTDNVAITKNDLEPATGPSVQSEPVQENSGPSTSHAQSSAKDDLAEILLKAGFTDDNLPTMDSQDIEALLFGSRKDDWNVGSPTAAQLLGGTSSDIMAPPSMGSPVRLQQPALIHQQQQQQQQQLQPSLVVQQEQPMMHPGGQQTMVVRQVRPMAAAGVGGTMAMGASTGPRMVVVQEGQMEHQPMMQQQQVYQPVTQQQQQQPHIVQQQQPQQVVVHHVTSTHAMAGGEVQQQQGVMAPGRIQQVIMHPQQPQQQQFQPQTPVNNQMGPQQMQGQGYVVTEFATRPRMQRTVVPMDTNQQYNAQGTAVQWNQAVPQQQHAQQAVPDSIVMSTDVSMPDGVQQQTPGSFPAPTPQPQPNMTVEVLSVGPGGSMMAVDPTVAGVPAPTTPTASAPSTPAVDPAVAAKNSSNLKWEQEEALGPKATISAVLYANLHHPDLMKQFPSLGDRQKQVNKIWRALSVEQRSEYVKKARENRSASRIVRTQQSEPSSSPIPPPSEQSQQSLGSDISTSGVQTPSELQQQLQPEAGQQQQAQVVDIYSTMPATPHSNMGSDQAQEDVVRKQKQLRDLLQQQNFPSQQSSTSMVTDGVRNIMVQGSPQHQQQQQQFSQQPAGFRQPFPPNTGQQHGQSPMRVVLQRPGGPTTVQVVQGKDREADAGIGAKSGQSGQGSDRMNDTKREGDAEEKVERVQSAPLTHERTPGQTGLLQRSSSTPALIAGQQMGNPGQSGMQAHGQRVVVALPQQSASVPSSPVPPPSPVPVSSPSLLARQLSHPPMQTHQGGLRVQHVSGGGLSLTSNEPNFPGEQIQSFQQQLPLGGQQMSDGSSSISSQMQGPVAMEISGMNSAQGVQGQMMGGQVRQPGGMQMQPGVRQVVVQQVAVGGQTQYIQQGQQQYIVRPQQVISRPALPGQNLGQRPMTPNMPPANIIRPTAGMQPGVSAQTVPQDQQALLQGSEGDKPLLLQEQPLLLQDLVEQEKKEQQRHVPVQNIVHVVQQQSPIMAGGQVSVQQSMAPVQQPPSPPAPPPAPVRALPTGSNAPIQAPAPPVPFNMTPLAAPPMPPTTIDSDESRQKQVDYERWLDQNQQILAMQLNHFQSEVERFRKVRKLLVNRQRQLRKTSLELSEQDALTLERITTDQSGLQKQLEQTRKATKQHTNLLQDFNTKFRQPQPQQQFSQQQPQMGVQQQQQAPMGQTVQMQGQVPQQQMPQQMQQAPQVQYQMPQQPAPPQSPMVQGQYQQYQYPQVQHQQPQLQQMLQRPQMHQQQQQQQTQYQQMATQQPQLQQMLQQPAGQPLQQVQQRVMHQQMQGQNQMQSQMGSQQPQQYQGSTMGQGMGMQGHPQQQVRVITLPPNQMQQNQQPRMQMQASPMAQTPQMMGSQPGSVPASPLPSPSPRMIPPPLSSPHTPLGMRPQTPLHPGHIPSGPMPSPHGVMSPMTPHSVHQQQVLSPSPVASMHQQMASPHYSSLAAAHGSPMQQSPVPPSPGPYGGASPQPPLTSPRPPGMHHYVQTVSDDGQQMQISGYGQQHNQMVHQQMVGGHPRGPTMQGQPRMMVVRPDGQQIHYNQGMAMQQQQHMPQQYQVRPGVNVQYRPRMAVAPSYPHQPNPQTLHQMSPGPGPGPQSPFTAPSPNPQLPSPAPSPSYQQMQPMSMPQQSPAGNYRMPSPAAAVASSLPSPLGSPHHIQQGPPTPGGFVHPPPSRTPGPPPLAVQSVRSPAPHYSQHSPGMRNMGPSNYSNVGPQMQHGNPPPFAAPIPSPKTPSSAIGSPAMSPAPHYVQQHQQSYAPSPAPGSGPNQQMSQHARHASGSIRSPMTPGLSAPGTPQQPMSNSGGMEGASPSFQYPQPSQSPAHYQQQQQHIPRSNSGQF